MAVILVNIFVSTLWGAMNVLVILAIHWIAMEETAQVGFYKDVSVALYSHYCIIAVQYDGII